jgi:hypothetical protein
MMATVTSAHPVNLSRHMLSSSPSNDSSLERTVSASSSTATVHPLDSTTTTTKERDSPSSTSSSPTYQSNSSSSMHKTISTTVSSINTAGSLSPPLPYSSHPRKKHDKTSQPHATSTDTAKKEHSWNAASSESLSGSRADSRDGIDTGQTRKQRDQWSYDGSQDNDGMYSSLVDEETPMQYPPISEEDKEARAIELVSCRRLR